MYIEREYICRNPECFDGTTFHIIHSNLKNREKQCPCCGKEIRETGSYWRADGKKFIKHVLQKLKEQFLYCKSFSQMKNQNSLQIKEKIK